MNNWLQSITFTNWPTVKSKNIWGINNTKNSHKTKKGDRIIFYVQETKNFCGIFEVISEWHEATISWPDETRPQDGGVEIDLKPIQIGFSNFDKIAHTLDFTEEKKGNALNLTLRNHPTAYANSGKPLLDKDCEIIMADLKNHQEEPDIFEKLRNDYERKSKKIKNHFEQDFWLVAAGRDEERKDVWNEFLTSNIVGVGWNKTGDVSNLSRKEIKSIFEKKKYEQGSDTLYDFTQIKPNDIVFVNDGKQGFFGIGKVIGPYRFDTQYSINHHVLPVEWITTDYINMKPQRRIPGNPTAGCSKVIKNKNMLIQIIKDLKKNIKTPSKINTYTDILKHKKQIVLYGPPGTGKTFQARQLANDIFSNEYLKTQDPSDAFKILQNAGFVDIVQFHPSYSYENFVEGIRPVVDEKSSQINYKIQNGIFKKLCLAAEAINDDYDHCYALINDHIPIKKPIKAEEIGLSTSFGGGMNEYTKKEFKKVIDYVSKEKNIELPESFSDLDNFSSFFRLNTKDDSKYGDIDGVRYHFSEHAHSNKKFLDAIEKGDVAIAYHDLKNKGGFFGIGVIKKGNLILKPNFILIIDEINRGNLSKIFGELIYGLEYRDTEIKTQYSEFEGKPTSLKIPKNLFVIGTMNTADRSISLFDTALRRRFAFVELLPNYDLLSNMFNLGSKFDHEETLKQFKVEPDNTKGNNIQKLSLLALYKINGEIMKNIQLGREKQIGHSYLIPLVDDESQFYNIWKYEILPLLEEFYYSEIEKVETIFGKTIFDKTKGIKDFENGELVESLKNYVMLEDE